MKRNNHRSQGLSIALSSAVALVLASPMMATAQTVLLSDNFDRSPANTKVGSAPTKDTSAAAQADANTNWVSSWGANNNPLGGSVTQTYTTYLGDQGGTPRNYKVDSGGAAISGNWLNNNDPAFPIKSTGSANNVTQSLGITGFGWTQINYDFANSPTIQAADKLRVTFDLYRTASGNQSWYFGTSDETGVANGNAGSPALNTSNDISLYFRGVQASTYGMRDNGAVFSPVTGISNFDAAPYAAGTVLFPQPIPIVIDIIGTNFTTGTSTIELTVGGVLQDLNGTDVAGFGREFTWDGGTKAYMGFGSNSSPVEGTVAAPIYRAQGIDNLGRTVHLERRQQRRLEHRRQLDRRRVAERRCHRNPRQYRHRSAHHHAGI
jgi:hypothetical protein